MAKYTLLKLVQKVLSSLSSDEVSSINDTVESMQVVDIIEDVYFNLIENSVIPELEDLIRLESLADSDHPNYLKLPSTASKISEIYYNVSETSGVNYKELTYVTPSEFLKRQLAFTDETPDTDVILHFDNTKFIITNNKMPSYWTTFDDEYLVFNSWDSSIDSTLQASKTMTISRSNPVFTRDDDFVPDIDDNLFPMLLNEAKSWAYQELKQTGHAKAEQQSRKQKVKYQRERERIVGADNRPDYGRR